MKQSTELENRFKVLQKCTWRQEREGKIRDLESAREI
jgi:hypothetical protein